MKAFQDINLGYSDAINYKNNRRYKDLFSRVFVKDEKLERLMQEDTYYLIGDKGTGKTAYSVFLENNEYENTQTRVIDLDSTDYKIFMNLRKLGFIQLSDFTRIWKIILLVMACESIQKNDIAAFGPRRSELFENLRDKIDSYYQNAYVPEVANTIKYIFDEACSSQAGINFSALGLGGELQAGITEKAATEFSVQKFQNNLIELERNFQSAFSRLKINKSKFIIIDSIDVRLVDFSESEYLACIQGLAQAIWSVNADVFRTMPESKGFLKAVLSIRTDMFASLNLHNQANKVRDNSVLLDWRTTYKSYRASALFKLCNNLLSYQNEFNGEEIPWDYYFPWVTDSTNPEKRDFDDSFINCLRFSLSRPRDLISIMKAIQNQHKKCTKGDVSTLEDFKADDAQNEISNYYIDEAKDWCLHKFSDAEFNTLTFFFHFLDGKSKFNYEQYKIAFDEYVKQVEKRKLEIFEELFDADSFLQLLYDLNMICYYDKDRFGNDLFRFCYREREIYNLSPQVKTNAVYGVHNALLKALNLGWTPMPSEADLD